MRRVLAATVSLVCLAAWIAPAALADIDLEWRPLNQTVDVGDSLGIGLYAVSDTVDPQGFSAVQVIIEWDPVYLELTGNDDTGGVDWMGSSFMPGNSFGINEADPPADGNGMWVGTYWFGQEYLAQTEGTLLTTITFDALAKTDGTPVSMLESLTIPTYPTGYTKVLDLDGSVLGMLGDAAWVEIVPEPASLSLFVIAAVGLIRRGR